MHCHRNPYANGQSMTANIGGRSIQYEPGLPASGMTAFGENGFLMGPPAFQSNFEQNATVLQELYRLTFSQSAAGMWCKSTFLQLNSIHSRLNLVLL